MRTVSDLDAASMLAGAMIYAYCLAKDEDHPGIDTPVDKLLEVVYNGLTEVGVDDETIAEVIDVFRKRMEEKA